MVLFVIFMATYVSVSLFWRLWTRDPLKRRKLYTQTVSIACRVALWLMRFKVNVINRARADTPHLLIGNHLGMLDILVMAANKPALFVTSVEMKNTPGLGILAEMGGCLYVERRDRSNIHNELSEIRQALKQGYSVALYPEGTSSNGERVLPLKKTLMTAAAGTGVPILPVVINFRKINGEPMSHKWRDYVCWYGEQSFFPSVLKIFSVYSVEVDFEFCEEITVHSEEQRRELAAQVQKSLESKYTKIPMPEGVPSLYAHLESSSVKIQ